MANYVGLRDIVDKLKSAKTQEHKREILEYYSYETLLKRVLRYTYNPLINFNMDEWIPKHNGCDGGIGMSKFMHVPEDIFQGKFTQEEAEFACDVALMRITDTESDIFIGMLKKDIGVDLEIATINSVWEDLILEYPVREVSEYDPAIVDTYDKPLVAQEMTRGLRVNVVVRGNTVEYRTKTGELMKHLGMWNEQFSTLAQHGATVFDGHMMVVDEDMNVIETDNDKVRHAPAENIRFVFWDAIRYDGFVEGKDNRIGYNWRFNGLEHMMMIAHGNNPNPCYRGAHFLIVKSPKHAIKWSKLNQFPFILKNISATWSAGKTKDEMIMPY